jgi:hypothetical protein
MRKLVHFQKILLDEWEIKSEVKTQHGKGLLWFLEERQGRWRD